MKMHFFGSYTELQQVVDATKISGSWKNLGKQVQFQSHGGAILNWWPSTGTISFQGKHPASSELERRVLVVIESISSSPTHMAERLIEGDKS